MSSENIMTLVMDKSGLIVIILGVYALVRFFVTLYKTGQLEIIVYKIKVVLGGKHSTKINRQKKYAELIQLSNEYVKLQQTISKANIDDYTKQNLLKKIERKTDLTTTFFKVLDNDKEILSGNIRKNALSILIAALTGFLLFFIVLIVTKLLGVVLGTITHFVIEKEDFILSIIGLIMFALIRFFEFFPANKHVDMHKNIQKH